MQVSDFQFDLPDELIALYPQPERSASRLLTLDGNSGELGEFQFNQLDQLLGPDDLLVLNDTRVIPARMFGRKASGGKLEVLVERVLSASELLAHVRASKAPKPGTRIILGDDAELEMVGREGDLFHLRLLGDENVFALMNRIGHMPLPPYIDRADEQTDQERYQTVYSRTDKAGAVAAPTAGLHFDEPLFERLAAKGVRKAFVTLHVGAGTFQPVRVDRVEDHHMHSEYLELTQEVVNAVNETRARGGKVIAVGTTSVRCLETAARDGELKPYTGETDIFIYPGYQFQVVDRLITNFHLPESTLLMLVSAFAGVDHIRAAYAHAIAERYRFFSYGDAMLLTRRDQE